MTTETIVKHTAGPWLAKGNSVWAQPDARGAGRIALVANTTTCNADDSDGANARLMAAAPALLDELSLLLRTIECRLRFRQDLLTECERDKARAAIELATGEPWIKS